MSVPFVFMGYIFVTRDYFREWQRIFVGHIIRGLHFCNPQGPKCLSVLGECPLRVHGLHFVTRDSFREYIRGYLLVWVTKM